VQGDLSGGAGQLAGTVAVICNLKKCSSMKTKLRNQAGVRGILLKLISIGIASAAMAVVTQPFSGWDNLTMMSSDIVIARCSRTPNRLNIGKGGAVIELKDGMLQSDIEVVSILKGATNLGPAQLSSRYWPRQSELYLIFSTHAEGFYHAPESYRVIPLGMDFPTNALAHQSLDEQIRTVLSYRLRELNLELQQKHEEKKRLEEGLQELAR
jgi:hypothetical protein